MGVSQIIITLPEASLDKVVPILVKSNLNSDNHQKFASLVKQTFEGLVSEADHSLQKSALFEAINHKEASADKPANGVNMLVIEANYFVEKDENLSDQKLLNKLPESELKAAVAEQVRQLNQNLSDKQQYLAIRRSGEEAKLTNIATHRFYVRAYIENKIMAEQASGYFAENLDGQNMLTKPVIAMLVDSVIAYVTPNAKSDRITNSLNENSEVTEHAMESNISSHPMPSNPVISLPSEEKTAVMPLNKAPQFVGPVRDLNQEPHIPNMGSNSIEKAKPNLTNHADAKAHEHSSRHERFANQSALKSNARLTEQSPKETTKMHTLDPVSNISLSVEKNVTQSGNRLEIKTSLHFEEVLPDKIVRDERYEKIGVHIGKDKNAEQATTNVDISKGRVAHYESKTRPPYKPVVTLEELTKTEQESVASHYLAAIEKTKSEELKHVINQIGKKNASFGAMVMLDDQLKLLNSEISKLPSVKQQNTLLKNVAENADKLINAVVPSQLTTNAAVPNGKDEPTK